MVLSRLAGRTLGATSAGVGAVAAYRYYNITQEQRSLPRETLWEFPSKKNNSDDYNNKKHVVVIGGGVVGVTAAYKLALAGHSVVVLEPRSGPGQECSGCAAGGMQRSNPTVDKDSWLAVLKCILPFQKSDYKFFHMDFSKTLTDPFFWRWLFTFTQTSLFPQQPQQNQKQMDMLNFTDYAVKDMLKMMTDPKDDMSKKTGYNSAGSLTLSYEDTSSVPKNPSQSKRTYEPYRMVSSTPDILETEPSVRFQQTLPKMAKLETESCSASSERWTQELATRCATQHGVTFLYDTTVRGVSLEKSSSGSHKLQRICRIQTNRGTIDIPNDGQVVVAAGAWTPHILALAGFYAPVYPLKGYAMSVSSQETKLSERDLPSRIVNDKYMYTCRLGDEIKITSIGEFSGWSTKPSPAVDAAFRKEAVRQFPQLKEFIDKAPTRCGHRPFCNDGVLLLGRCDDTCDNLLVSCGPGANGWKLAMGSGEIITRLVSGMTEAQITNDLGGTFDVQTLSPVYRVRKAPLFSKLCRARWGF